MPAALYTVPSSNPCFIHPLQTLNFLVHPCVNKKQTEKLYSVSLAGRRNSVQNSTLLNLVKTTRNVAKVIKKAIHHFWYLGVSNSSEFKSTYWTNAKYSVTIIIIYKMEINKIFMQLICSPYVSMWYCDGLLHYNNKADWLVRNQT